MATPFSHALVPRRLEDFQLPEPWPESLLLTLREQARVAGREGGTLVVLDDDPTGTQTVHDVPVLTEWSVDMLKAEFNSNCPCFFILTNSRSMDPIFAESVNRDVAKNLIEAAEGRSFHVVSRSDSTLRGHYPLETDVLEQELGPFDATFLIPYFEAGGRYTIQDVHYVLEDDALIPVAQTPFARDPVFGYQSSDLPHWVAEKTRGRIRQSEVLSIRLEELRKASGGLPPWEALAWKLCSLNRGAVVVVNACSPRDMEVFAQAALLAEKGGRRFLYRTAAQFVSARLGMETHVLRPTHQGPGTSPSPRAGGLVVVGSHVPKTTAQLEHLLQATSLLPLELNVEAVLNDSEQPVQELADQVNRNLAAGKDVVLYTSRHLLRGENTAKSLTISVAVSNALVRIVQSLTLCPNYFIAKGGITSSDLASKGLAVRRARVSGQLLPGIPVWELGEESRFPGLTYVVFPGNVGGVQSLAAAVEILSG